MAKGKAGYRPIFSDVPRGNYYSEVITWCYDHGIISGYSNSNRFGPDDYITRQDLCVIAARYSKYLGRDTNSNIDLSGFCDYQQISSYAYNSVNWIVSRRIMTGSKGYIKPFSNATRAECAKIFLLTKRGNGDMSTAIPSKPSGCVGSGGGSHTTPPNANARVIPQGAYVTKKEADAVAQAFLMSPAGDDYWGYWLDRPDSMDCDWWKIVYKRR